MPATKLLTRANTRPLCGTCGRPVIIIDLYCRISDDYDGDGGERSVDDQETDGRLSVEDAGVCCYVIGEVWRDPHKSAWKKNVIRPQFNSLMQRLETGQADGMWVYDLTRFSRKPIEGERLIEIAERGLIVLSGDSQYDLSVPEGKGHFRDAMTAAALESDKIQKRTRRGKRLKATKKGKSNASYRGIGRPGAGISNEDLTREQDLIGRAADLVLARKSLQEAADFLNSEGLTTVTGRPWSNAALKQTLRSPALCGLIPYKGEIVPDKKLPGPHALSEEKWRELIELFDSRSRGAAASFYLLSGLVRCGRCGAVLYGRPESKKPAYRDGEMRRSYFCMKIKRQRAVTVGCARTNVDWRFLDEAVTVAVIAKLGDERNAERLIERAAEGEEIRTQLLDKIAKRKSLGRDKAAKAGRGELEDDEYEAWLDGHRRLLNDLNAQLAALDVPEAPSKAAGEVVGTMLHGSLAARRALVREAFPRLTIRPAATDRRGDPADRIDWIGESLND
jgi:DNA invertase Pin-like site-specific DNA recombinase